MQTTTIRPSIQRRIIITLIPFLSFLCMYILEGICVDYLEYGSASYEIVGNIGIAFIIPMFVSIPYIIKVNRQKIVFDGYILKVTPTIGYTKEIQVRDIKACNILKNKTVVLMDEKSNVLCKYPKKLDEDNVIYYALKRNRKCVFSITDKNDNQAVLKDRVADTFQENEYNEDEIDVNVFLSIRKAGRIELVVQLLIAMLIPISIFIISKNASRDLVTFSVLAVFIIGNILLLLVGKCFRIKQFNIIKSSYYRVAGVAVDEANGSVIYEFEDKYGEIRRRPSNKRISSSIACGTRIGQRKMLWYSPYANALIESEELKYNIFEVKERAPFRIWIKKHPFQLVICIVIIICVGLYVQKIARGRVFIYTHDGRTLQTEWVSEDKLTKQEVDDAIASTGMKQEEYELWLRQSYYPYFYVNDLKEIDFLHIDIEAARYDWDEDTIQDIKDNLANSWGIEDRKSLIKTTDSLLEKGDKYTYARTLEKMGEEEMDMPEDTIYYTYKLYKPDELYMYLGTYYAYNEIGDAGVDAWDYCRCIRLYAFGYICGYISYDEYLIHSAPIVCYLQDEYNSWTQMYESYYYGDLLFLGRNKYSNVGARYGGYADYEEMGEKAERVIRY